MNIIVRHFCVVFFIAGFGLSPATVLATGGESIGSVSLGYRTDSLDWNIDGGSGGPNILSELEWRDLDIFQVKAEARSTSLSGIVFRGYVDYGWVLDGINQDSDYSGNNRTAEFSRSINAVDGSRVLDMLGGLGFTFYPGKSDRFQFVPMIGYSYHEQRLAMRNGFQVIPASGPFAGLNSSYDAQWSGPWLGADFVWALQDDSTLFLRMEFHRVNYSAEANWNLRPEFAHPVSFEHKANGRGSVLELGWQNALVDSSWVWGVSIVMQSWRTESGIDRVFFSDGSIGATRLNEVNWSSNSINFTLQKSFTD